MKRSVGMSKRNATTNPTILKQGDMVMVISGGHKVKRPIKGKVAKIIRFVGDNRERVVLEGLNYVTRHQKARGPQNPAGKIQREAPMHVSNVMYYAEKLKKPVRLRRRVLKDGSRVRGYMDSKSKEFVQIV